MNGFKSIKVLENNYRSVYCHAPCGLTNIFNNENKIGCYDSLKLSSKNFLNKNLSLLQRGSLKKEYPNFMKSPVACIKNIDINYLVNKMNYVLGE